MFRRRPFRRPPLFRRRPRSRPAPPPTRRPLPPRVRQALTRANRLMADGQFAEAAGIFERLSHSFSPAVYCRPYSDLRQAAIESILRLSYFHIYFLLFP